MLLAGLVLAAGCGGQAATRSTRSPASADEATSAERADVAETLQLVSAAAHSLTTCFTKRPADRHRTCADLDVLAPTDAYLASKVNVDRVRTQLKVTVDGPSRGLVEMLAPPVGDEGPRISFRVAIAPTELGLALPSNVCSPSFKDICSEGAWTAPVIEAA